MDDAVCPTPGGRPADSPPDPEMVEGGSQRGRRVVGDEGGYAARGRGYGLNAKDNFEFDRAVGYRREGQEK